MKQVNKKQNISLNPKKFSEHSALKGLPTSAMTKRKVQKIMNSLNKNHLKTKKKEHQGTSHLIYS